VKTGQAVRRVLASRLATRLTQEELRRVCGRGTSFYGSGGQDASGRWGDIEAGDCVDGPDVFVGPYVQSPG
jgi:hypothetical protein